MTLFQILLILALILLVVQLVLIIKQKRDYTIFLVEFHNLERALEIQRNRFLDSERERVWANKQLEGLLKIQLML